MKKMKLRLFIYLFIISTTIIITNQLQTHDNLSYPQNPKLSSNYSIPYHNIIDCMNTLTNGCILLWNFSSSDLGLVVRILNSANYERWTNKLVFSYTELSNGSFIDDSGAYIIPSTDTWHLVYYNCNIQMNTLTVELNCTYIQISYPSSAPQNLTIKTTINGINLTWKPPLDLDFPSRIIYYQISRRSNSGEQIYMNVTSNLFYLDSNVTDGETYFYSVRATNKDSPYQWSPLSDEISIIYSKSYDNLGMSIVLFSIITIISIGLVLGIYKKPRNENILHLDLRSEEDQEKIIQIVRIGLKTMLEKRAIFEINQNERGLNNMLDSLIKPDLKHYGIISLNASTGFSNTQKNSGEVDLFYGTEKTSLFMIEGLKSTNDALEHYDRLLNKYDQAKLPLNILLIYSYSSFFLKDWLSYQKKFNENILDPVIISFTDKSDESQYCDFKNIRIAQSKHRFTSGIVGELYHIFVNFSNTE